MLKEKKKKKGKINTYTLCSAAEDFEGETSLLVATFMLKEQHRKQKCMLGAVGAFRYACSNLNLKASKVIVYFLG